MRKIVFLFVLLVAFSQIALAQGDETLTMWTGNLIWNVPAGSNNGSLHSPVSFLTSTSVISQWGIVLSCKDFKECDACEAISYKVSQTLYKLEALGDSYFPVDIVGGSKLIRYWREEFPELWVKDINNREKNWNAGFLTSGFDMVDPNLPSDQMVKSIANSSIGLTVTQKAYMWTNQEYDNFVIVEYTFTNTGNYDGIKNPDNQLHEVYIGLQSMSQVSGAGGLVVDRQGGINEGNDDWVDYYGEQPGDSLSVIYSWDGDAEPQFASENDEGDPYPQTGQPLSPQYLGRAVLYAPKSVADPTNAVEDQSQPVTTHYGHWANKSGTMISVSLRGDEKVHEMLSEGSHIEEPFDWSTGEYTSGNIYGSHEYLKTATMAFGPYDFDSGESIRIVTCLAVGSISLQRAIELGEQFEPGTKEYLDVVRTGRDSLFAIISKAKWAFYDKQSDNWDFSIEKGSVIDKNIKDPPPAPSVWYLSDSAHVHIEWEDISQIPDPDTGELDWEGYRVYRRLWDQFELLYPTATFFERIFETTDGSVTHYDDFDVDIGRCYWYYVAAFDEDGIESNLFANMTFPGAAGRELEQAACALRPQARDIDNVVVVPNPYHVHATDLNKLPVNTIHFFNLPYKCRIRVYNQTGDLIFTDFKESESNVYSWNQISDASQHIVSGLYIFVVDEAEDQSGKDLGNTMGKFVVIR